jgi:hypothetical protein
MSSRPLRLGIVGCGNVLTAFEPPIFAEAKPGEPAHLMHDRSRKQE